MKKGKRRQLEAAGWAIGSVQEFLGLSDADAALIENKLLLARRKGRRPRKTSGGGGHKM